MKSIKKLFLGLLTLVLTFCVVNTVSADTKGSIVVNGTKEKRIYEIYKIFDLTYSGSNVAYRVDSDWKNFFDGDGSKYIVDTNSGSLNSITIGSQTKYINITNDNIAEFTSDALVYASELVGNDGSSEATGETLTFDNLDLGYYLVYPKGATDITEGNGSICSLTSTLPEATVNIKATYPTITKTVDDANSEVGQMVEFKITGIVPDTTGFTTYTYKIDDTMTAGLLLESSTSEFKVLFGNTEIDVEPTYSNNGFSLEFNMVDYQDYVGEVITITYKAKVTEEAVNSDDTNNSVTLTYSNDPKQDTTYTTTPIEVFVYSSGINVIKVDANDSEVKLAGASFVIQNKDGKYYQATNADGVVLTEINTTTGLVDVNWVATIEEATLLVTGEDGTVLFTGVENGTYNLVEVEAPEGYNKLTGPVTIKVGYDSVEGTNLGEVAVIHEEIVENNSGRALPETGGIGTKIFIGFGSLLMLGSAILLIVNKRMAKEYK